MGCLRRLSFTVTRTHPTLQMCILFVLIPCTLLPQRCDMARHETQHRHQHAAHSIHYRECTVPSTFSIHCPSINALVRSCGAVSEHRRSASPASLLMSARAKTQQAFGVSEQSRDARPSTATVDVVAIADARHLLATCDHPSNFCSERVEPHSTHVDPTSGLFESMDVGSTECVGCV